jgi:hypothetical protein
MRSFAQRQDINLPILLQIYISYTLSRAGGFWILFTSAHMNTMRSDRTTGNRGAYEKARLTILKTQTVCGICGKPVDFSYKYPHPLSPTVDHIIPVSKGGHPSDLSNLQLAHRCCNRDKSDNLFKPVTADPQVRVDNRDLPQSMIWKEYRGA